jgi:hypothetical protein
VTALGGGDRHDQGDDRREAQREHQERDGAEHLAAKQHGAAGLADEELAQRAEAVLACDLRPVQVRGAEPGRLDEHRGLGRALGHRAASLLEEPGEQAKIGVALGGDDELRLLGGAQFADAALVDESARPDQGAHLDDPGRVEAVRRPARSCWRCTRRTRCPGPDRL